MGSDVEGQEIAILCDFLNLQELIGQHLIPNPFFS
jgi:hypothetical protein